MIQAAIPSTLLPAKQKCWRSSGSIAHQNRAGFTLIELSITLVIIGLIIGGVLVGQDLIKNAEMKKIQGKLASFEIAVNTFRLKYDGLPGDHKNAYQFFGGTIGCTNAISSTTGTGCNGDGDSYIYFSRAEDLRFWQHLQAAGLISESILMEPNMVTARTGTASANPAGYVPVGPRDAVWWIWCNKSGIVGCSNSMSTWGVNNVFRLSSTKAAGSGGWPYDGFRSGVISPLEAYEWDKKFDDGHALTGKILGMGDNGTFPAFAYGVCGPPWGTYNLAQNQKDKMSCMMFFAAGF